MSSEPKNDAPPEEEVEESVAPEAAGSSEAAEDNEQAVDPMTAERDAYRDTAQRLQAEFENFRKRVQKQQSESAERAGESLAIKLLPVLDTIDLAKAHDPNGSLEQVSSALIDVLTREGLERIAVVDQPFDPEMHEAVVHEEGDGEARVSEELRAGYRWKGRVVRAAMVKVTG